MIDNLNEAPINEPKDNICYNCAECSSMIEIIEINKDIIKFKCLYNKHENTMKINEYLEKMKKYNDKNTNNDKCNKHNNNKYISYCFDCNFHLCNECLKNREHINHHKNYIIEINPTEEELNIIKDMINKNKKKIKNLKIERDNKLKDLEEKLKINKNNIEESRKEKMKEIKNEENEEIKKNSENYKNEIKILKQKYEKEIKEKK